MAVEAQMRKGSSYGICIRVHHLDPLPGFLNKNSINIWLLPTHSINCYQKGLQQHWSLATFWLKAFQWLPVVFRLRVEPLGWNFISSWQPLPSSSASCSQDRHFSSAKSWLFLRVTDALLPDFLFPRIQLWCCLPHSDSGDMPLSSQCFQEPRHTPITLHLTQLLLSVHGCCSGPESLLTEWI